MNDETVVITGASRGIGKALAEQLIETGAHLVICSRKKDEIEQVGEQLGEVGDVTALRADVRDEFDVERLMERAANITGEIDYLVANAGVYHGSPGATPLSAESYAAFDDHLRTNARGVFTTVREALAHLGDDARVLVSSGAVARNAIAGFGSYGVSKATAESIARAFATETEYTVGVVDPGQVATELAGERGHNPADVAEQFLWALADAPEELVDGTVIDRRTWRQNA